VSRRPAVTWDADRQVRAAAAGLVEPEHLVVLDTEPRQRTVHQGEFVLGEDSQVVAGVVGDTLRKLESEGLRRRTRRLDAEVPQARRVGHQLLVGHHREGIGLLGDDGRAHVRLSEQLDLVARAARLGSVGGVLLGQGGP
jgi:hypothetical protein